MWKFLSKWLPPVSLIIDAVFATCFFYEGWIVFGVLTSLVCVTDFISLFIMSDYKKK